MAFEYPLLLILIPVFFLFGILFWKNQYGSLLHLKKIIHHSKFSNLTSFLISRKDGSFSFRKIWTYVVFSSLSILSLVIALASPYVSGDSQIQTKQASVYLVFDASWSMYAKDMSPSDDYAYVPRFRFEEARFHAMALSKSLTDISFGVITFAGLAVQHSHPVADHEWIYKVIFDQIGEHNTFNSGSNFGGAFQELLNSSKYLREGFQVVLYSDGDASDEEKAEARNKLPIFNRLKIPIHVVALGKPEGSDIELTYDLLNQVDSSHVVEGDSAGKEYQTYSNVSVQKRLSKPDFLFLESIAKETGGTYTETNRDGSGFVNLVSTIESGKNKNQVLLWEAGGKKSLAYLFFILPFLFFLYDFVYVRKAVKIGT